MKSRAGTLYRTPTISPLLMYEYTRDGFEERLDDPRWQRGLGEDVVADIRRSLTHWDRLDYYRGIPGRRPTLDRKFQQLRESGVTMLIGTDSGVPGVFHSDSTWHEIDTWVNRFGVPVMDALRAATYWPAVQMGVIDEVGTVSPGKRADVIAVRGDVLRYPNLLGDVDLVIKGGVRYK
jgi:predicted amidohydrolase YtcJ